MNNIESNSYMYNRLATNYNFNSPKWHKSTDQCLIDLVDALSTFTKNSEYVIELSSGKEACININPIINSGQVRHRTAGIYVSPTKGIATLVLNADTFTRLQGKYELPEYKKIKNNQYYYVLGFCELCSWIEAILSL